MADSTSFPLEQRCPPCSTSVTRAFPHSPSSSLMAPLPCTLWAASCLRPRSCCALCLECSSPSSQQGSELHVPSVFPSHLPREPRLAAHTHTPSLTPRTLALSLQCSLPLTQCTCYLLTVFTASTPPH